MKTTHNTDDAIPGAHPFDPAPAVASELGLSRRGVRAVIDLLSSGNTVPFVARYRKEATGGLDEVQIRSIEERKTYLEELEARRQTILETIAEQGKLTPSLQKQIAGAATKQTLEDLYRPYKRKRRTRATKARERGLEPLAQAILDQVRRGHPTTLARDFVNPGRGVPDVDTALASACDIVAESFAERPDVRAMLRAAVKEHGRVRAKAARGAAETPTKFEQYYDFAEKVRAIPSHRYLAVCRGEREGVLKVGIEIEVERLLPRFERLMGLDRQSPFADLLRQSVADGFKRLLSPSVENEVRAELKTHSDNEAVEVFARNLEDLLLAPPLGEKPVVGIDPGFRTGCKCAALDPTGKYLESLTIFPHQGKAKAAQAAEALAQLLARRRPTAIAVGNGTAGRETERFVRQVLKDIEDGEGARTTNDTMESREATSGRARRGPLERSRPRAGERSESRGGALDGSAGEGGRHAPSEPMLVLVNESGASVYSASELAREEFPDLDLTVRGAISIARRLQDPLAELVKIDPKAIGVGQYQHDVHQPLLQRKLDEVVESCVNRVGVEVNTASAPLLSYVAGVGPALAKKIVGHRDAVGRFRSRHELLDVSGLGPKTFEQAAGFLRVRGGAHPLDASAVHPERYDLVAQIARDLGVALPELVGDEQHVQRIAIARYVGDGVGEPTLRDIVSELQKPGRDPRRRFEAPRFREDVQTLEDLREGMTLEGVVTNVTHFGAFVDVGVHQDGLVHISELADRYVRDPSEVVQVGQRIQVRVLAVDLDRRRISLSARSGEGGRRKQGRPDRPSGKGAQAKSRRKSSSGGRGGGGQKRGTGKSGEANRGREQARGGEAKRGRGQSEKGGLSHNPFADVLKRK